MQIGYADTRFSKTILIPALLIVIFLAIWAYREMPDGKWHWVNFIAIYLIATIFYMNVGVWLHEQLHCLVLRRTNSVNRTHFLSTEGLVNQVFGCKTPGRKNVTLQNIALVKLTL